MGIISKIKDKKIQREIERVEKKLTPLEKQKLSKIRETMCEAFDAVEAVGLKERDANFRYILDKLSDKELKKKIYGEVLRDSYIQGFIVCFIILAPILGYEIGFNSKFIFSLLIVVLIGILGYFIHRSEWFS
jgi:hypothetical protein